MESAHNNIWTCKVSAHRFIDLVIIPKIMVFASLLFFLFPLTVFAFKDCNEILLSENSTGDAVYQIDPDGPDGQDPIYVECLMSLDNGGWTKLTDVVASTYINTDGTSEREYLFVKDGKWYRTPLSPLVWDWNSPKVLTGTYYYSGGSFYCGSSSEVTRYYGVSCSNGGGNQWKALIYYSTGKNPTDAKIQLCQDKPGIFGYACQTGVTVYIRNISIPLPNLRIIQMDMPGTVESNEHITIRWLVRNDGLLSAQGDWTDMVYLSSDENLDPDDTLLGELNFTDGIEMATEIWRSLAMDMPVLPPGTYNVIVQTDADSELLESDENDNNFIKQINYLRLKQLTVAPDKISIQLAPGEVKNGNIDLVNLGDSLLTGVQAALEGNSENITFEIDPPTSLGPQTVEKVSYSITASNDSVTNNSPKLTFATAEGETAMVTFDIVITPGHPELVANPDDLDTTMVRGLRTFFEFEVINIGSEPVSNLKIVLPEADWLSLVSPSSIKVLEPGEKIKVGLSFNPSTDLPLGPYAGTFALSADNANAQVPFKFTAVSDKIGGLSIVAKDEFTYFADDHPTVIGANVKISDPFDGTVIVEGITDTDGLYAKKDLFEGFYNIEVKAENHGTYNAIVQIKPEQIMELTAFLPRQLVTYTWKVEPVQTEDRYIVNLEAVFETHVPAPVITVEPMILDLGDVAFDENGKATVKYTITNHGLIAAHGATIHFGTHSDYQVLPLNQNIGEVSAMTSLEVPVVIERLNLGSMSALDNSESLLISLSSSITSDDSDSNICGIPGWVGYDYVCGEKQQRNINLTVVTGECPPSTTPVVSIRDWELGIIGGSSGGGGVTLGGGVVGSNVSIRGPSIQMIMPCELLDCEDGEPCEDSDNNECTSGICAYGSCISIDDDSQTPTQKATGDCKAEVCIDGAVISQPDNSDVAPDDHPGNCLSPSCQEGLTTLAVNDSDLPVEECMTCQDGSIVPIADCEPCKNCPTYLECVTCQDDVCIYQGCGEGPGDGTCDTPCGECTRCSNSRCVPNDTCDGDGTCSQVCGDCAVCRDGQCVRDARCDLNSKDDDGDGKLNGEDSDSNNPNKCGDADGDTCDDCISGTYGPRNDGNDFDSDGLCDAGDPDMDDDGVPNDLDECPQDRENRCDNGVHIIYPETGSTLCVGEEVTVRGTAFGPSQVLVNGISANIALNIPENPWSATITLPSSRNSVESFVVKAIGLLAGQQIAENIVTITLHGPFTDCDFDKDGVVNAEDSEPYNKNVCLDSEEIVVYSLYYGDGCDDCSNGIFDPKNDGPDQDSDQICDMSDNCQYDYNIDQKDTDLNGIGDICEGCSSEEARLNKQNWAMTLNNGQQKLQIALEFLSGINIPMDGFLTTFDLYDSLDTLEACLGAIVVPNPLSVTLCFASVLGVDFSDFIMTEIAFAIRLQLIDIFLLLDEVDKYISDTSQYRYRLQELSCEDNDVIILTNIQKQMIIDLGNLRSKLILIDNRLELY